MTKELTISPDKRVVEVGNKIDLIVNECLPVAAQESQNFVQALTLANGIKELRRIFLTDENIKDTVKSMQNTHLGFMTDKTDLAIWKSQQKGSNKEIKPYRYEDVAEVCIEAMLKGYRITNNEFNMIAGRFYAAKNGKFRRINETEGVTDFQFTTTSPAYEKEQGGIQYAKVQGFASWKKDGQLVTLGSSTGTEDKLVFKIRVNKFMGEDAIVGKALSKLFSRVLMRLEGKIMPESTDVSNDDVVDAEYKDTSDLSEKIKEAKKEDVPQYGSKEYAQKMVEKSEGLEENPETVEENQEEAEQQKTEETTDQESEKSAEDVFRDEWADLTQRKSQKGPGFSTYFYNTGNRSRFESASQELKTEAHDKWKELYPESPCPKELKPKDDEKSKMISAIQTLFSEEAIERALSYQHQNSLDDCTLETLELIYNYLIKSENEDLA